MKPIVLIIVMTILTQMSNAQIIRPGIDADALTALYAKIEAIKKMDKDERAQYSKWPKEYIAENFPGWTEEQQRKYFQRKYKRVEGIIIYPDSEELPEMGVVFYPVKNEHNISFTAFIDKILKNKNQPGLAVFLTMRHTMPRLGYLLSHMPYIRAKIDQPYNFNLFTPIERIKHLSTQQPDENKLKQPGFINPYPPAIRIGYCAITFEENHPEPYIYRNGPEYHQVSITVNEKVYKTTIKDKQNDLDYASFFEPLEIK